jgi:iron complex outermembrane receptor protein
MKTLKLALAALFATTAQTAAYSAFAQSAAADESDGARLEEIVVTAQRTAQNLQSVPIAVTALSAKALEQQGVVGTIDLTSAVPGLVLAKSTFTVQPFLRGVGNSSIIPGSEPSVATYVDGIYQTSANGLLFSFNNIDRIEVLKGPQGTLFGRNATGGLIQIVTRDPTEALTSKVSVGYGNYNSLQTAAYLSGGNEFVSANLAVVYNDQSKGWGKNLFTPSQGTADGTGTILIGGVPRPIPGVPSDVGTSEEKGVRSKILFTPSDALAIKLGGHYLKTDSDEGVYRHGLDGARQLGTGYVYTGDFYDANVNTPFVSINEQYGADADIAYDFDFATFKSITSYQHSKSINIVQSSSQPIIDSNAGTAVLDVRVKSYSEELQLLSRPGGPLQWLTGIYLTRIDSGYFPVSFVRGNFLQGGTDRTSLNRVDSGAVFAQGTLDIAENTALTLGARYTIDKTEVSQSYVGTDQFATPGTPAFTGVLSEVVPNQHIRQSKVTWRAALDHHFTDDLMGYVSANTGYKSGGYNVGTMCAPAGNVGNCPAARIAPPVEPETLTAYETGLKSEMFDHRLRLNASAFLYDYKNLQVQTLVANNLGQLVATLTNAASTRNYGAEIDMVASLSNRLDITAGAAWLEAEYRSFSTSVLTPRAVAPFGNASSTTNVDVSGNTAIRSPRLTANLGVNYSIPTSRGEVDLNATMYHSGSFFWDVNNRLEQDAYETVNVSAALTSDDGRWKVKAWARNLLGEEYYSFIASSVLGDQGVPAAPRTFGGAIEWNF